MGVQSAVSCPPPLHKQNHNIHMTYKPTWPVLTSNCHMSSAPDSCPPLNRYLPDGEKHTGGGGRGGGQTPSPAPPSRRFDDDDDDDEGRPLPSGMRGT